MRLLKKLFAGSKDEKTNKKHKLRVLISTLCCVVLCLSFLVGTTWAWYTKTVSSQNNVLEIGEWTEETTEATEETTEATQATTEEAIEETTEDTIEETTQAVEETEPETTQEATEDIDFE